MVEQERRLRDYFNRHSPFSRRNSHLFSVKTAKPPSTIIDKRPKSPPLAKKPNNRGWHQTSCTTTFLPLIHHAAKPRVEALRDSPLKPDANSSASRPLRGCVDIGQSATSAYYPLPCIQRSSVFSVIARARSIPLYRTIPLLLTRVHSSIWCHHR